MFRGFEGTTAGHVWQQIVEAREWDQIFSPSLPSVG